MKIINYEKSDYIWFSYQWKHFEYSLVKLKIFILDYIVAEKNY